MGGAGVRNRDRFRRRSGTGRPRRLPALGRRSSHLRGRRAARCTRCRPRRPDRHRGRAGRTAAGAGRSGRPRGRHRGSAAGRLPGGVRPAGRRRRAGGRPRCDGAAPRGTGPGAAGEATGGPDPVLPGSGGHGPVRPGPPAVDPLTAGSATAGPSTSGPPTAGPSASGPSTTGPSATGPLTVGPVADEPGGGDSAAAGGAADAPTAAQQLPPRPVPDHPEGPYAAVADEADATASPWDNTCPAGRSADGERRSVQQGVSEPPMNAITVRGTPKSEPASNQVESGETRAPGTLDPATRASEWSGTIGPGWTAGSGGRATPDRVTPPGAHRTRAPSRATRRPVGTGPAPPLRGARPPGATSPRSTGPLSGRAETRCSR